MPQQVTRLSLVFAVLLGLLLTARHILVPKTFGELGHYRAAALESIGARQIKYAGRQACADCHAEVAATLSQGHHQTVACEVCHGAAANHAGNPTEVKPPAPRRREGCPVCHAYDPSRPTGFPQIDPVAHNPRRACIGCHQPHSPEPPRVPEQCSACHGEIARTKAQSPHVLLPCTRCHETDQKHLVAPRSSLPAKPKVREFCGGCHSKEASGTKDIPGIDPKDIPRIDLASHGQPYVCWQCHYPHNPEAR